MIGWSTSKDQNSYNKSTRQTEQANWNGISSPDGQTGLVGLTGLIVKPRKNF